MRKAPAGLVSAVIAIAGVVVAFGVLHDGGPSETAALPTHTAATMIPVTPVEAATPRPPQSPAPRPLTPQVGWTPIEARQISEYRGLSFDFLLDVQSGQLYAPAPPDPAYGDAFSTGLGWADTGEIVVGAGNQIGVQSDDYIGKPLGALRRLPAKDEGTSAALSSKGWLAYQSNGVNLVLDEGQRRVAVLPPPPWRATAWSAEGRYLLLLNTSLNPSMAAIWDGDTQQVLMQWPAESAQWSATGRRVVYEVHGSQRPSNEPNPLRIKDIASGLDLLLTTGIDSGTSPADRYAVVSFHEDEQFGFRVHNLVNGDVALIARGAWFGRWIDDETIGLVGDVCGPADYYTVKVPDGTLRKVTDIGGYHTAPQASADGRFVAYTRVDRPGFATVVQSFDGTQREFKTGTAMVWTLSVYSKPAWSPDGRFLIVSRPGGKDGPCFSHEPQPLRIEVP
jgi:hypothetical protein